MKKKLKFIITLIIIILVISIYIMFNKKQNINKIYPSVVHLKCENDKTTTVGSGIVYESKENLLYIVTNYHIVKGYSKVKVYDEDFNKESATILNYDEKNDIAILTIKNSLNVKKANFDLKNKIKENEKVYVFTSFRGKNESYIVKDAVVTKVNKKIEINNKKISTIKLSYEVEKGDSGSPVISKKGKVIGMIFLKDKNVSNYGYAIPINKVLKNIEKLVNQKSNELSLGALMTNSTNTELLKEYNIDYPNNKGVIVLSLKKKYPLYNSGLEKGDLIVEFDNVLVEHIDMLQKQVNKHKKNDVVSIKYYRSNNLIETKLKLTK